MTQVIEEEREKVETVANIIYSVVDDLFDNQYQDLRWVALGCHAYATGMMTEVETTEFMTNVLNTPEALTTFASNLLITGFISGMKLQSSFVSIH